jgi:hypothetical protein
MSVASIGPLLLADSSEIALVGDLLPAYNTLYSSKAFNKKVLLKRVDDFQQVVACGGMLCWPTGRPADCMILVGEAMHAFMVSPFLPAKFTPHVGAYETDLSNFTATTSVAQPSTAMLQDYFSLTPTGELTWTVAAVISKARTGFGLTKTGVSFVHTDFNIPGWCNPAPASGMVLQPAPTFTGVGAYASYPVTFYGGLGAAPIWAPHVDVLMLVVDVPWFEEFGLTLNRYTADERTKFPSEGLQYYDAALPVVRAAWAAKNAYRPPARIILAMADSAVHCGPGGWTESFSPGAAGAGLITQSYTSKVYDPAKVQAAIAANVLGQGVLLTPGGHEVPVTGTELTVPYLYQYHAQPYGVLVGGSYKQNVAGSTLPITGLIGAVDSWDVRSLLGSALPLGYLDIGTGGPLVNETSMPFLNLGFAEKAPLAKAGITLSSILEADQILFKDASANTQAMALEVDYANQSWGMNIVTEMVAFVNDLNNEIDNQARAANG